MAHKVIAISQTLGSGGEAIGALVAEKLGIGYVDREILERAANAAGVSIETIEEADRVPSFLSRMIELLGRYPVAAELIGPTGDVPPMPSLSTESYRGLIEDVIRGIADTTDAVILGHGSQFVLKDYRNVIRVFCTSPIEARVARIMAAEDCDRLTAERMANENVASRRSYFQEYYKANWNEAQHYDICIRTDKITVETAADMIILAAHRLYGS
jgi:cytidylate kinase